MLAVLFVIDLPDLGGREKIEALGVPVRTLISFEGRRSHRPHPEEPVRPLADRRLEGWDVCAGVLRPWFETHSRECSSP